MLWSGTEAWVYSIVIRNKITRSILNGYLGMLNVLWDCSLMLSDVCPQKQIGEGFLTHRLVLSLL